MMFAGGADGYPHDTHYHNFCPCGHFCPYCCHRCGNIKNNNNKKFSFTFSISLTIVLCFAFMLNPVASVVETLNDPADICGSTLNNPDGYILSFEGNIMCDAGNGPTLTNKAVLDCGEKAIIGSNGSSVGLDVQDGSEAVNCIVSGFENGIQVSNSGDTVRLTDCVATNNSNNGAIVQDDEISGRVIFTRCTFENNNQGVEIERLLNGPVFFNDCTVQDNTSDGAVVYSKKKVVFDGGVIQNNGGDGVSATRVGAPGRLILMNIQILNNAGYGVSLFGKQAIPKIAGVIMEGNAEGNIDSWGVTPEVTCANLFGDVGDSITDTGGICMDADSCENDDRTELCAKYPLIVPPPSGPKVLSPSEFCGEAVSEAGEYELDPQATYSCMDNGVSLSDGASLDCKDVAITGSGSGIGIRVPSGGSVAISNCDVSNFEFGIMVGTRKVSVEMLKVAKTKAHANVLVGIYVNAAVVEMSDVVADENGESGIYVKYDEGAGSTRLERIRANGNKEFHGIDVDYDTSGSVYIKDSETKENENSGIALGYVTDAQIEGCESTDNGLNGIHFFYSSGKVENSVLRSNGVFGFIYSYGSSVSVSCSELSSNEKGGVRVSGDDTTATMEVNNSMVHDNKGENLVEAMEGVFSALNNVYACNSETQDLSIVSGVDVSDVVCNGSCGRSCSDVSAEFFAMDLKSNVCPEFGWWDASEQRY